MYFIKEERKERGGGERFNEIIELTFSINTINTLIRQSDEKEKLLRLSYS